jgi:hypothetical protein
MSDPVRPLEPPSPKKEQRRRKRDKPDVDSTLSTPQEVEEQAIAGPSSHQQISGRGIISDDHPMTDDDDHEIMARDSPPTVIPRLSKPLRTIPATELSSALLPIPPWREYFPEQSPMETVQNYIQDLHVIEITHTKGSQNAKHGIPLCPFIIAHLQSSNRIIPYVPLTIPSCPGYIFLLLYVLKETTVSNFNQIHTEYTAVFSCILTGQGRYPSTIAAKASYSFVEQVRSNVLREKERARKLMFEARRDLFPLRTWGI